MSACFYSEFDGEKKNGLDYDYWALVECVRTVRGPRQQVMAMIGKLDLKEDEREKMGWEDIQ